MIQKRQVGKPGWGCRVSVLRSGYWHRGILTRSGTVIHNSKNGGVIESTYGSFVENVNEVRFDYLSMLQPDGIEANARSGMGKAYSLLGFNCEHFASWAHGLEPESKQLQLAGLIILSAFIFFFVARTR
jgi:hypothetical protein